MTTLLNRLLLLLSILSPLSNSFSQDEGKFITTWKITPTDHTITFPINTNTTHNYYYNFTIEWGDGTQNSFNFTVSDTEFLLPPELTHNYTVPMEDTTYEIKISATTPSSFPSINFGLHPSENHKITGINQWGTIVWESLTDAFSGCQNLAVYTAMDIPILAIVANTNGMFKFCYKFNGDISNWDVSNVTNMNSMFYACHVFNQDISSWEVSKVQNMHNMFSQCSDFNIDLSGWDVASVSDFGNMFQNATTFNQSLGNWDISKANAMYNMLKNTNISTDNYDATLEGWSTLDETEESIPSTITLYTDAKYCNAEARNILTGTHEWTIEDGGLASSECPIASNSEAFENAVLNYGPNPANEELNFFSKELYIIDIAILDLTGKTLKHEHYNQNTKGKYTIALTDLNSGIYYAKIKTDAGAVVKRFYKK